MKKTKIIISIFLIGVLFLCANACSKSEKLPVATIEMESGEEIVVELSVENAPETVRNFIALANSGFYDGLSFHHNYPGFAILGGDPLGTGWGDPGYHIKGEFVDNGVENHLSHTRGVLSMARGDEFDSAGSQFFITVEDASSVLNHLYAGFGVVTKGMDVVDRIVTENENTTDEEGKIANPVIMKKVTVETFGKEYGEPEKLPLQ